MTYRVGSQHHTTFRRQVGGGSLRLGLPLLCVARLKQNGGVTARLVGPVKIAGDIEIRQALEQHFLDGVAVRLDLTRDLGIQRPVVVGQTAQDFQQGFANLLFPALRLGNRVDLVDSPLPLLELPLRDLVHPAEKGVALGFLRKKRVGNEKSCTQ